MRKFNLLSLLFLLTMFVSSAFADTDRRRTENSLHLNQDSLMTIQGRIIDSQQPSEGLPGVSIQVKGTNRGSVSDLDGNFSVTASKNSILVFSMINHIPYEHLVTKNEGSLIISLEETLSSLEEVVVVGYGTAKKRDLTGSIARVDASTFKNQPATQLTEMLSGTVAGFNSNQSTAASGGGSMQIRGPKSLNASTNPMIVLDGVIYNGSLSDINPSDIETMDILKDASSAAVYGARAAAGVVLVTTKKGRLGKPTISFSSDVSLSKVAHDFKPYGADGYLTFRRDVLRGYYPQNPGWYYDNPTALPSGISLEQWRNASNNPQADNTMEWLRRLNFFDIERENYQKGETVDWYNEVMQKGIRQNYDVSIGGGSEAIKYYWSLGYQDNEGIILGDKFSTVRSRLNVDATVTEWLKVGTNLQFADRNEGAVPASLGQMFIMSPYGSMFDENGDVEWYPNSFATPNPLIDYYGRERFQRSNSLFASIYSDVSLPFGLKYKVSFQPRYGFAKDYNFYSSKTIAGGQTRADGYGTRNEATSYEWILDHLVHWNKRMGTHSFDLTLLYSTESSNSWTSNLQNQTFVPNQNLGFHGIQFGTNPALSSNDTRMTGDAAMARLNYGLLDRYLFTFSARRDGYSAFGNKNPRAWFPAGAFAWIVSDESFFKSNIVDQLKFRLSWGVNGNRDIGAYAALAQLSSDLYYNGSKVQVGIFPSTLANHSLMWEKTESINIGLDAELLRGRFNLGLDYYDMTTSNLLINRILPRITGFSSVTSNLGELGNKGFELSMRSVNMQRSDFKWTSSFTFSFNRNKIKRLFGDFEEVEINGQTVKREVPDYSNKWFPGAALDRVWDYEMLGIWQEEERAEAAKYGLSPGDFKVRDLDGNGQYEAIQDKQFVGYAQPRYRLGLRNEVSFLQNFTFSLFLRADLGHIGSFSEARRQGGIDTYDRRNVHDFPYWTPENRNNEYARLNANTTVFGGGIEVYKSRSFLRVQDMSLAYDVPLNAFEKLRLNSVRVFIATRNLYTFHQWPGWDPESISTPMPKNYSIGVNITL